jgi:molybdopterin-guanine dinucleotide biosynthesis protein A
MIGLYSTFKELNNLEYKKVFVIACDNPFIKSNVISFLIDESKTFDCCIPKWDNGFLEPLLAIYPIRKAYRTSEENIKKSNYKLTQILSEKWKINYISIEKSIQAIDQQLITFKNINKSSDIEDLNAFKDAN